MEIVQSFCTLCALLLIGKFLRSTIPLLRKLYLPASVIGGAVGLAILTCFPGVLPKGCTAGWMQLPGFLINIVFAALFLGASLPPLRGMWKMTATQVCFGQICAWGQYVAGLGVAMLILVPVFHVTPMIGNLVEIGFEGGHGTVGGLTETFTTLNWEEGKDLGYTMATAGMVLGIVLGMTLINWALRKGIVKNIRRLEEAEPLEQLGFYSPDTKRPDAGKQTVYSDSLDSLAFHIAIVGMALLLGWGMKEALLACDPFLPECVRNLKIVQSFPLFPLCMIGGLIVQGILVATKLNAFLDGGQVQRIAGASLDFLVLSAMASIRLDFIAAYWLPLLLLIIAGTLWNLFCVLVLAPRVFEQDWFERAIAEFGQMMGVTATGLLLLRTADPENKTCAMSAFGSKQLIHEPIMGGGIWTSMALPLVLTLGGWTVFWLSVVAVIFWLIVCYFIVKR
ncbi:MAG: sodium/glutamate symporter [Planctomycetia bacterium]|nr:sodium/glutamate symporter [Planctomycetia bacterium]